MDLSERVADMHDTLVFWKGVAAGVIGSAVFFSGLVALVYYVVQIVQVIK